MNDGLKEQSERFARRLVERLIEQVKAKGFKTTVIADEIGIGQATMSRYIQGRREMPMSVFIAICTHTGLNADKLINGVYAEIEAEKDESDADAMLKSFTESNGDQDMFGTVAYKDENKDIESRGGDGR